MSVQTAQGRLNEAAKDLLATWQRVRPSWRDRVAQTFEEQFIADLEQQVRRATTAMSGLAETLHRARSECS